MTNFIRNIVSIILKSKKLRFLIIGGYNALFGLVIGNIILLLLDDQYILISLFLIYLICLFHNFFTLKKLVFKSNISVKKGLFKMNVTNLISLIIQIITIPILVKYFNLSDNLSYSIIFFLILILKYYLHLNFTFKKHEN